MPAFLITGLLLGLLSSFHCVGMCGPLALALSWRNAAIYQLGRILTYGGLGLVFGLLGRHFYLAGWQHALSLALGGGMLAWVIISWIGKSGSWHGFLLRKKGTAQVKRTAGAGAFTRLVSGLYRSRLPGRTFVLGMANGFLPCGMVYLALSQALLASDARQAMGFMLCFGAGTWPLMMSVSVAGKWIGMNARRRMRKILPLVMTVLGCLLILRGLNLGIPFVSPMLPVIPAEAISCH
jgi:sulfite exporter TauE/SafE